MNSTNSRLVERGARFAALLGTVSLLALANAMDAHAQGEMVAQAEEIPETVLITGSLIRGTAAVGVPVVELRPLDFVQTGALTVTDLFRTVPSAVVQAGALANSNAGNSERSVRVNLRGLDSATGARSLFLVDGARVPLMSSSVCIIDPSIIPALAIDRIDVLVDGASATYGSDAIAGVLNIVLRRGYDGAQAQLRYTAAAGGGARYQASGIMGPHLGRRRGDDHLRVARRHSYEGKLPFAIHDRSPAVGLGRPAAARSRAPSRPACRGRTRRSTMATPVHPWAPIAPIAMPFRAAPA